MKELPKPCPFCGGKAVADHTKINFEDSHRVICPECKIRTAWYAERKHAIWVWNKREGQG